LAASNPIRSSGKKLPNPRFIKNDSDGPSSPASFAVNRSRPDCESIAAARTPTGDPSTTYVPDLPKRGIAQPGDTAAQIDTTPKREETTTRLRLGTQQHTRIHVFPDDSSYGRVPKFCKTISASQRPEFPCR
jgi:hypothetical protein